VYCTIAQKFLHLALYLFIQHLPFAATTRTSTAKLLFDSSDPIVSVLVAIVTDDWVGVGCFVVGRRRSMSAVHVCVWVIVRLSVLLLLTCTSQAWMIQNMATAVIPPPSHLPPPPTGLFVAALFDNNSPSQSLLWDVRIASALASYVGLVAFLDRPRGTFHLEPHEYEIRPSSVQGAGLGMYAARDLPKDTVLGTYPGVVLPLSPNSIHQKLQRHPHCEAYVWRFSDSQFIIDPTDENGTCQDLCRGGNPRVPLSTWMCQFKWLTPPIPTTLCRINEPPKGMDINVITNENLADRTVTFVLERNVVAGEELFMDYGLTYDRSGYNNNNNNNDNNNMAN
jgi:hypothetical protein